MSSWAARTGSALLVGVALVAPETQAQSGFPATGKQLLAVLDVPAQYAAKKKSPQRTIIEVSTEGWIWGMFQALLLTQNACITSTSDHIESPQDLFDAVRDYLKKRPTRLEERSADLVIAAIRTSYPCK